MATLFQAPPHSNSYHHRRHHRQGILLSPSQTSSVSSNYPNPYEDSTLSSGSPSGSASSSSSTSSHTSLSSGSTPTNIPAQKPVTPSRRIRFAPLPDPRRSVLITDDGDELPLPEAHDATQFPCPATPLAGEFSLEHPQIDTSSIGSSSSSSQRNSYSTDPSSVSSTPGTATPVSITIQSDSCDGSAPASPTNSVQQPTVVPAKSSWPKPKSLNILRSFKKSSSSSSSGSSHTLTPTPSIEKGSRGVTKEEILTLGTINLFRSTSRESRNGNESDPGSSSSGWGLTRWTSAGTTGDKANSAVGSPLARTQSTQSYTSKSKRPSSTGGLFYTPSPSRSKAAAPVKQNTVRTGTRMLNGRVYGGPKRPQTNANPFANARDEEPEFVEWGYGGMGSVKGAKSAGVTGAGWEKLHGGASVGAKGKQAGGSGVDGDAEEDDGSGLGWVKKRKEERERKKKEEEERRKAEEAGAEKIEAEAEAETPAPPPLSAESTPTVESPGALSPAIASLRAPARPTTPSSTHTHGEEEHVLRAVTVPAPMPRHHRGHSRGSSINNSTLSLSHAPVNETLELPKAVEESKDEEGSDEDEDEGSEEEEEARRTPEEDDEEEEDEDEEEEERKRKTALGAGVEKISRHKEVVEDSGEA
ncbi:hypothetical protein BDQ12DRAFT_331704 [Crucibulum laeve]|uniref:Uncharacterized protein n=1 Tax=Crucibulum laeve TaxID=68775 RepID=A0A5C3LSF2_9AGAR|nr:hypothetical protein BDQ12DRAFT_331704 [Crucibulum laeve]